MTSSLPFLSTMSHAQPEPKRASPAALTFPVNLAGEPNEESIPDFRSPLGSLAPSKVTCLRIGDARKFARSVCPNDPPQLFETVELNIWVPMLMTIGTRSILTVV